MKIKPGGVRIGLEAQQEYLEHFVGGLVATDGVVFSAVATVGTTAVEVLNQLIDPGFSLGIKKIELGLTQRFIGLNGSFTGSLVYYWEAREEWFDPGGATGTLRTGAYVNLAGTYAKVIGTLVTVDDTFSGYFPVGSLSHAPLRLRLMAIDRVRANALTGAVKNSSYVRIVGNVIPGT